MKYNNGKITAIIEAINNASILYYDEDYPLPLKGNEQMNAIEKAIKENVKGLNSNIYIYEIYIKEELYPSFIVKLNEEPIIIVNNNNGICTAEEL